MGTWCVLSRGRGVSPQSISPTQKWHFWAHCCHFRVGVIGQGGTIRITWPGAPTPELVLSAGHQHSQGVHVYPFAPSMHCHWLYRKPSSSLLISGSAVYIKQELSRVVFFFFLSKVVYALLCPVCLQTGTGN